ncbi:transcriptional regulator family: Fungal Specific TF [Paecilomyces variotii]|nr:transcriptional regulator family: Fungal Specific TF [Paecilomyces variotii]
MSTKRACDACHRRKIRCAGGQPCWNCGHASLSCTYNAIPQKKGPKGNRAKVISELRETKLRDHANTGGYVDGFDTVTPPLSPPSSHKSEIIDQQLVSRCIESFFIHLYPTIPIFEKGALLNRAKNMSTSIDNYCLMTSLCAFVLTQPGHRVNVSDFSGGSRLTSHDLGKATFEEAIRIRKSSSFIERPNSDAVVTAYLLFGCCFYLDKHSTAWFYLREAATLAEIIGMDEESYYLSTDTTAGIRERRLFWVIFITERSYALQKHRSLTLHPKLTLPTLYEDSNDFSAISALTQRVNLFRPLDDDFVGLWNKTKTTCTAQWLVQLQQQLTDVLPEKLAGTESQVADLKTTQQWLHIVIWRVSMASGFLSSTSPHPAMRFTYPVDIARDLIEGTSDIALRSMSIHGSALTEKLFDIACSLMDVMACTPANPSTATIAVGPKTYLNRLCSLLSRLPGGSSRYLPVLLSRVDDLATPIDIQPLPSPFANPECYFTMSHGTTSGLVSPSTTLASPGTTEDLNTVGQQDNETLSPGIISETPFIPP